MLNYRLEAHCSNRDIENISYSSNFILSISKKNVIASCTQTILYSFFNMKLNMSIKHIGNIQISVHALAYFLYHSVK